MNPIYYIAGLIAAFFVAGKKKPSVNDKPTPTSPSSDFYPPVQPLIIRNDSKGQGHHGASRGSRLHNGTDFEVYEGQTIRAPFSGMVTASRPYSNDATWLGCRITGADKNVAIWYMIPSKIGRFVEKGEPIGYAQSISQKYTPGMKDHIHVRLEVKGSYVDPMTYYTGYPQ